MQNSRKIVITLVFTLLPNLDDLNVYLKDIWNRKWLTNNGHYHQELEKDMYVLFLFLI